MELGLKTIRGRNIRVNYLTDILRRDSIIGIAQRARGNEKWLMKTNTITSEWKDKGSDELANL